MKLDYENLSPDLQKRWDEFAEILSIGIKRKMREVNSERN